MPTTWKNKLSLQLDAFCAPSGLVPEGAFLSFAGQEKVLSKRAGKKLLRLKG